jgi:hypothetical protein
VAYLPAPVPKKRKKGRPRKYGKKLKLMKLFDSGVTRQARARKAL